MLILHNVPPETDPTFVFPMFGGHLKELDGADSHEFAKMYAKEIKAVNGANNWFLYGYPTLREVVMGLYDFFCQMIEQEIKDRAQEFRK